MCLSGGVLKGYEPLYSAMFMDILL